MSINEGKPSQPPTPAQPPSGTASQWQQQKQKLKTALDKAKKQLADKEYDQASKSLDEVAEQVDRVAEHRDNPPTQDLIARANEARGGAKPA